VCVFVCSTLYTTKVDKISSCITINGAVCPAVLGYMLKKHIICSVICLPQLPVSKILLLGTMKFKLVKMDKLLVGITQ
jgi:hypothetical protein